MHVNWIWIALPIAILAILGILGYLSKARRNLLRLRIDLDKTWAGVDALMKQQHDELPKLLGTCRGYMPHDHAAFEPIAQARADYLKARTMQEKTLAHIAMTGAVEGLFEIAGDYPGLVSNNNFTKLRRQHAEMKNNIEEQQDLFNELVHTYNRRIRRFPESLAARRAHLEPREPIPNPEMANGA
ncbi:MAG TPA: LemA family protein [Terriglobia bacterium]|nr:LemA family protein [Terriglobia bacterium]